MHLRSACHVSPGIAYRRLRSRIRSLKRSHACDQRPHLRIGRRALARACRRQFRPAPASAWSAATAAERPRCFASSPARSCPEQGEVRLAARAHWPPRPGGAGRPPLPARRRAAADTRTHGAAGRGGNGARPRAHRRDPDAARRYRRAFSAGARRRNPVRPWFFPCRPATALHRILRRLAHARGARRDLFASPTCCLLDEPTNYLDLEATLWLEQHIARYPHTVMVISHDRDLLDKAVDWILHLEAGKLTLYRGGYSAFDASAASGWRSIASARRSRKPSAARLQAFVDRFRAKATKARQAQSRVKLLAKLDPVVALVAEEAPRRSRFRSPRSACRRRSSRSTTFRSATSRVVRCSAASPFASTTTIALRFSAPTAMANRPW